MDKNQVVENEIADNDRDKENTSLPENVTEAPQDEEHMDLRQVKGYPKWVRAYLNVSDDEGHLLCDRRLEKEVKKVCIELNKVNLEDVENHEVLLQDLRDLSLRYATGINVTENITIGTFTKYRIRLGMLFNFQKIIVKKILKQNWTEWFKANFDISLLRSAQDFMRIAEIPSAIRYAFLGKERIIQILRQIGKPAGDDPIGQFLRDNGVEFVPEAEPDYKELKIVTDIAIARQKLNNEDLEEVPDDKVEALTRTGVELTPYQISQLKLVKSIEGNLGLYMDDLIASGGKVEPIITPEKKAETFKKALDRFLDKTADALKDAEYLTQVDIELCRQIKEKIVELERKITSITN